MLAEQTTGSPRMSESMRLTCIAFLSANELRQRPCLQPCVGYQPMAHWVWLAAEINLEAGFALQYGNIGMCCCCLVRQDNVCLLQDAGCLELIRRGLVEWRWHDPRFTASKHVYHHTAATRWGGDRRFSPFLLVDPRLGSPCLLYSGKYICKYELCLDRRYFLQREVTF